MAPKNKVAPSSNNQRPSIIQLPSSLSLQSSFTAYLDGTGSSDMLNKHPAVSFWQSACSDTPKTKLGQRLQMLRMLVMLALPITGIIVYAGSSLSVSVDTKEALLMLEKNIKMAQSLGYVIHSVQMERLNVVKYLVNRNRREILNLVKTFSQTDERLQYISYWPITDPVQPYLESAATFQEYISRERDIMLRQNVSIFNAITFYNNANLHLLAALTATMTDVDYEGMWQLLVAYRSLVTSKENYGVALSVGVERFYGKVLKTADRNLYIQQIAIAQDHLNTTFDTVPELQLSYEQQMSDNPTLQ